MPQSICTGKLYVDIIFFFLTMWLNVIQILLLTLVYYPNRIKTNITHTPGDRMVSAVEHLCVGYYDAISKKKARAHVNERNILNYIMCPAVTKKLRHVSGDKSLVNPY